MKFPFVVALVAAHSVAAEKTQITIEAGDYDRRDAVVEFTLPPALKPTTLVASDGQTTPLQIGPNGNAWFIEHDLKRGERKAYMLGDGATRQRVQAEVEAGTVTLRAFGRTAFVYRTKKYGLPPNRPDLTAIYERGGYIHPVFSPSGKLVTDDYPPNHKHHHGIWFAWTHTEFEGRSPDFWNMGDGKGFVEFVSLDQTWSGPVHAGFISQHRQMDLTAGASKPKAALLETWNVKFYAIGHEGRQPYFVFDLKITDTCAHGPVTLPKYRYGGIGVRGHRAWDGKDNLNFLNSEGTTDRSKGDNARTIGRWAHIGGLVDGELTGIAVLGHPANVNAPQPQRIHPTEPFLNFAPQQTGELEITPEHPLTLRYRFVVADGTPDRAELDRLWNDYAYPPKVTVSVQ